MGEVYRARDPRLGREVAIKVLPLHLATDADALARFEREARSVAALNHPHILAIFDFGHEGPITYAATELLEGKTLRDELTTARPPLRRGLEIARQIAAGLSAAHDKGIVHRDLKPENVFLTRDGGVKILDFGLARAVDRGADATLTQAATLDLRTDAGTVLGTVGYMAPEQVRGRDVDHRADIFAFGAVLYEIIGGSRAFRAETSAEVLTAILREDPPELTRSIAGLTPAIDRLVRRCLEKDPEHRFQSARDLGFALDAIGISPESGLVAETPLAAPVRNASGRGLRLGLLAGLALAVAFVLGIGSARWLGSRVAATTAGPLTAFTFDAGFVFNPAVKVSPDGRLIAYTAPTRSTAEATGVTVWVRRLDEVDATPLPTVSDIPRDWAADGRSLLVTNGTTIAAIDAATAQRTVLGQTSSLVRGAAWLPDASVLAATSTGIVRLQRGAAEATIVIPLDTTRDVWVGWPSVLPGGRRFLYAALPKGAADSEVRIGSLDPSAEGTVLAGLQGVTGVTFLPPDGIVYIKSQSLYAQAFDPTLGTTSGNPVLIARDVFENADAGFGAVSVSPAGVITYRTEKFPLQAFLWVDRSGRVIQEFPKRDTYTNFDLAPDATRVAVTVRRPSAAPNLLWLLDLSRGVATDISEAKLWHSDATWSPDGEKLAFRLAGQVVIRAVNGGPVTPAFDRLGFPETWSPDGRYLVLGVPGQLAETYALWSVDLTGREKPTMLVRGAAGLDEPRFSPDGRWLSYNDVEGARRVQVYAIPFPPTGQRYQLSTTGGTQARWRGDGRELYYLGADGHLMAVQVPNGDVRRATPPVSLFHAGLETSASFDQFAPTSDGQRFLLRRPPEGGGDRAPLHVIVNFDLKTRRTSEGER